MDTKMDKMENGLTLGFRIVYNVDDSKKVPLQPDDIVDVNKFKIAEMINQMDGLRAETDSPDRKRLCSIAISKLEEACMFMAKAYKYDV